MGDKNTHAATTPRQKLTAYRPHLESNFTLTSSHAFRVACGVILQLGALSADHNTPFRLLSILQRLQLLFLPHCGHSRELSMLLALLSKLASVLCIEYIFHYLSTDYVDAAVEFAQAYIQVLDLIHSQREGRMRDAAAAG